MPRGDQAVFAETNALLAVLDGDEDEARRILDDFLPSERRALLAALAKLSQLAYWYCAGCGERLEMVGSVSRLGEDVSWHKACLDAERAR